MPNDTSHWRLISDRQQQETYQRDQEELAYRKRLQALYQSQLFEQIRLNESLKNQHRRQEQRTDRSTIDQNVEQQRRQIEQDIAKMRKSNERDAQIDTENQQLEALRKGQMDVIKKIEHAVETEEMEATKWDILKNREEQLRRKEMIRRDLLQDIELNKEMKTISHRYERQYELHQLNQLQDIQHRQDQDREKFLGKMKARAKAADYGAHFAFQANHSKTLVERKKQEWQSYRDSLEIVQKKKEQDDFVRQKKAELQNEYRSQLKRQMEEKQIEIRVRSRNEMEQDKEKIMLSARNADNYQNQKRAAEQVKKRQLRQFLRLQAEQHSKGMREEGQMQEKQFRYNLNVLRGEGLASGDTYKLDAARKKQLETIEKAFSPHPPTSKTNYFAERGIQLIS